MHYISKFIPNLALISHPLRPLLKKSSNFIWTDLHGNSIFEIKNRLANAMDNSHYNPQLETCVECDSSRSSLGAPLEQLTVNGWKPIAFVSRFLNSDEERYSVNELELLGVVWSIEYFKNGLYGKHFTVITDHRALFSILKGNQSNKSYSSHLIRWIDRLLPFQFDIEHLPGEEIGLMDYISRYPSRKAKKVSAYDEEFIVAKSKLIFASVSSLNLKATESYSSHLIRWIDRLLPFQFDIEHLPGEEIGLMDYISRHPSRKAKKVSAYDEEFIVAKSKLIFASVSSLNLKITEPAIHLTK